MDHPEQLGVRFWARRAEKLRAQLVELPVAPLLWPLVAKHRPQVVPARDRIVGARVVLDVGAHRTRSPLGPQRQRHTVAVREDVHLLADHVGLLADGAREERRLLDERSAHLAVAVQPEHAPSGGLDALEAPRLRGQEVVHTFDGAQGVHGAGHLSKQKTPGGGFDPTARGRGPFRGSPAH